VLPSGRSSGFAACGGPAKRFYRRRQPFSFKINCLAIFKRVAWIAGGYRAPVKPRIGPYFMA
jgi:hypothetical protein